MNIELGAGCGDFGKLYYPECCLTDRDIGLRDLCLPCRIDCFCDADSLPFSENSFDKIIICNPYHYGFKELDEAQLLLNELIRILKNDSSIIIIGHESNPFCAPKRVEKRIGEISLHIKADIRFSMEHIDAKELYAGYRFLWVEEKRETVPNRRMILNVRKKIRER
jgi:SAM-dependent methyltransferase